MRIMMTKYRLFIVSIFCLLFIGFSPNLYSEEIMTVTGAIDVEKMGITLPHEHLLVDFIGADSTGYFRWDRDLVVDKVLPFLIDAKKYGVQTFIDCTPAFLGRDPVLLKILSQKSGINILTTTGFYGAFENKFVPPFALEKSADQLAHKWIAEWRDGIENTGIKPGIIKIAVDRNRNLSSMHEKLVRAAAKTHLATGLTIVSHTGPEIAVYDQLDILAQEGVATEAFVWTHAHEGTLQSIIDCAKKGVWISLDKVDEKESTIRQIADILLYLKQNLLLDKVLISHDAGWYKPEQPDGGQFRGFTSVFTHLIPQLEKMDFTKEDIYQIMVLNPKKAYAICVRKIES